MNSNIGLTVGFVCHVFPGTKPSEYLDILPGPRALNFDGKLAIQVLKAMNPNPDETGSDVDKAKRRVNMSRSKIDRRNPHTKAAIERRGLKL